MLQLEFTVCLNKRHGPYDFVCTYFTPDSDCKFWQRNWFSGTPIFVILATDIPTWCKSHLIWEKHKFSYCLFSTEPVIWNLPLLHTLPQSYLETSGSAVAWGVLCKVTADKMPFVHPDTFRKCITPACTPQLVRFD